MSLEAQRCPHGHLQHPTHARCRSCGTAPVESIDLSDREATITTWTVSHATPPGVREPNPLAIVSFDVDGETVSAIGGLTTEDVTTGDTVEPVAVEALREPSVALRWIDAQTWDGYRFAPRPAER